MSCVTYVVPEFRSPYTSRRVGRVVSRRAPRFRAQLNPRRREPGVRGRYPHAASRRILPWPGTRFAARRRHTQTRPGQPARILILRGRTRLPDVPLAARDAESRGFFSLFAKMAVRSTARLALSMICRAARTTTEEEKGALRKGRERRRHRERSGHRTQRRTSPEVASQAEVLPQCLPRRPR